MGLPPFVMTFAALAILGLILFKMFEVLFPDLYEKKFGVKANIKSRREPPKKLN